MILNLYEYLTYEHDALPLVCMGSLNHDVDDSGGLGGLAYIMLDNRKSCVPAIAR